jgi:glycosyltransferase involved in cell wall biosynthesis
MGMFKSLSIVLPAYNEEKNIEGSVEQAFSVLKTLPFEESEVIVVNDGSTDGTKEVLRGLSARHPMLRVFDKERNEGYGAALRTGFSNARSELIFYTDSDLQFDMSDIKVLLPAIDNYDIVTGYRMDRKDPTLRLFLAWCYNQLVRLLFGLRVRDVDCAFKLYRRRIFDKINIETDRFFVDAEILAKARRHNFAITETGVRHFPRRAGQSTVKMSHIFTTIKDMAGIWNGLHRHRC